jgi:hypothetical protein
LAKRLEAIFMSTTDDTNLKFFFRGFGRPTFTQVPDELFDELLSKLSGAELKVLLYVIRRTYGFKKDSDSISLSQLVSGIRTKDGEVLDSGTGLSKGAVAMAVKSLEEKGVLLAIRNRTREKGDVPTTYALRFNEDPVSNNRTGGSLKIGQAGVRKIDTQHTVEQHTVIQQDSREFEEQILHINDKKLHFREKSSFENLNTGIVIPQTRSDHIAPNRDDGLTPVGEVVKTRRQRTSQSASERRGAVASPRVDSLASSSESGPSGRSRAGGRRSLADQAPSSIAAVMEQTSGELYDEHQRSSLSRAVKLWQQSKQSESAFIAAIYAARKIAKQQGHIAKAASGEAGEHGLKNRMPYFMRVLEDQLGLKQDAPNTS